MKNRKNKLINFLKTAVLFFGISILLWNCEKEEINFSEKKIIEIIEFNQIDNKITNLIPEVKSKNTQKHKSTSSKDNFVFNFKEVVKLIDSLKNTRFTIEFIITNQPENIFYNLVLGENNEGEILEPLIYKYTIDNYYEFKQKLKVGHFKLKGKKEIFNYNSFKNNFNNVNSLAKTNFTPCGGDSTVVEFDSASGGFWWDEYQIKRTYIIFDEDGSFTFPKTSSKSSNDCGGGSPSGSTAAIIDTNKCPTGFIKDIDTDECVEDDIEIIGPSCKSFNYQNTTANWQEAAIVNISFHVYLYNDQGVRYLYSQLYSQPTLFGVPSNLFNGGGITSGIAAEISARALNSAIHATVQEFRFSHVSETAVDIFFREKLKQEFESHFPGGRAQFNSSTMIPPTQYQTYALIPDDCQ
jgi:hypothetical protein